MYVLCALQVLLREAENAGASLDADAHSSASEMTRPMSPAVSLY